MIGFIIMFCLGFAGSLLFMIRKKIDVREIGLFVMLSLLGFVVWLSIFIHREINPDLWISWLIDRAGL